VVFYTPICAQTTNGTFTSSCVLYRLTVVTQENTDIHSRHKPVTTGRIDARRACAAIAGLQMAGNKMVEQNSVSAADGAAQQVGYFGIVGNLRQHFGLDVAKISRGHPARFCESSKSWHSHVRKI